MSNTGDAWFHTAAKGVSTGGGGGQQGERGEEDLSSSGPVEGEQKNREEIF